jgi:hypothetical protein
MMTISNLKRLAAGAVLCGAVAFPALVPNAAHAQWAPGWRRPVVVAPPVVAVPPPQVVYPAPPPVYAARPYAHWVRAHRDWRGVWIPGHWA